ncbi:MAG: hypothetical protein JOZ86_05075 [Candidatus Eremiobacteraeota bacterium]|nr:hypothetical protein [Candidatus Eremiobacteraeota bacterium]
MLRRLLIAVALAAFVTACNGGNSTAPPIFTGVATPPTPTPTPTATPGPVGSASGTLTTSTTNSSSATFGPIGPFGAALNSAVGCPPTSVVSHLGIVFSTTQPTGTPTLAAARRRPMNIGGGPLTPIVWFTVTPDVNVNCPNLPTFSVTFPAGSTPPAAGTTYVAFYDPGNPAAGWNAISGPATVSGNTYTWPTSSFPFTLRNGVTYSFVVVTTSSTVALFTPSPTPTPTPTPTPPPANVGQHLYVSNDNTPGGVERFTLPLTGSSTPDFTIAGNDLVAVGVDSNGNLAAGDFHHNLFYFTAPLSGSSTPASTFANGTAGNVGQITFPQSGPQLDQLWTAGVGTEIDRFARAGGGFPSSTTAAQQTFPTGASQLVGLVFDSSLNMYLSDVNKIYVYAPPYNNPPAVVTPALSDTSYRKEAISNNQLFVSMPISTPQPLGRVDVYNLPLTSASVPAFTIIGSACPCPPGNAVNIPESVAFDAAGNLYVGDLGSRTVSVYAPPFSAASLPTVQLQLPAPNAIFGLAIGK